MDISFTFILTLSMDQVSLDTMHGILMKTLIFLLNAEKWKKLFRSVDRWNKEINIKKPQNSSTFIIDVDVEIVVIGETYNGENIPNRKLIN